MSIETIPPSSIAIAPEAFTSTPAAGGGLVEEIHRTVAAKRNGNGRFQTAFEELCALQASPDLPEDQRATVEYEIQLLRELGWESPLSEAEKRQQHIIHMRWILGGGAVNGRPEPELKRRPSPPSGVIFSAEKPFVDPDRKESEERRNKIRNVLYYGRSGNGKNGTSQGM